MRRLIFGLAIAVAGGGSLAANATVLYDNPTNIIEANGNCLFDNACLGNDNDFAAQHFTLSTAANITTVDYTFIQYAAGDTPTSTDWAFYLPDGFYPATPGNSPGTLVASGVGW
jgi:hypothetical protein